MLPYIKIVLLGSALGVVPQAAATTPVTPGETSAQNIESGVLWEIGSGTPFAYRIVPVQFSWRSRAFWHQAFPDGSRLILRHRLTVLADLMQNGPESRYLGFSASPSLELWNRAGTTSLFAGAGGGFGLTDARGIKGGLGQDFTLNWFMRGGLEHLVTRGRSLSAGLFYQHLSNGGMTNPNPGIDALGFTLGYGWSH
jgi:lipid A 3-O-deacylase